MCVILSPLAVTDLRAEFTGSLYIVDASDWGEAVVKTNVGTTMSKELLRRSLNKPSWTRLLSPFKTLQRVKGQLDPQDEMPEGEIAYVEHPLWETAAGCFNYELVKKVRARGGRRIDVGELRSFLMAEKDAGLQKTDIRVPISGTVRFAWAQSTRGVRHPQL